MRVNANAAEIAKKSARTKKVNQDEPDDWSKSNSHVYRQTVLLGLSLSTPFVPLPERYGSAGLPLAIWSMLLEVVVLFGNNICGNPELASRGKCVRVPLPLRIAPSLVGLRVRPGTGSNLTSCNSLLIHEKGKLESVGAVRQGAAGRGGKIRDSNVNSTHVAEDSDDRVAELMGRQGKRVIF